MRCSRNMNSKLFFAVLGGLGQFGIITRARIVLDKAPTRVKWVKLLYSNFSTFTRDEEYLVSSNAPNYVEGFVITNETSLASSFSSPSYRSHIVSLLRNQGLIYNIELEFQLLLKELKFIPGLIFNKDVPFFDFLNRVGNLENQKNPVSHPWLNLFIPKSGILDFNSGILSKTIPRFNETDGLFILYPLKRNKWDDEMSAVTPDEDIFYALGLLNTSQPNEFQSFDKLNSEILELCERGGIKVKQYLPNYKNREDWVKHFGSKWNTFQERKTLFDPKMILSPGQGIFNSV